MIPQVGDKVTYRKCRETQGVETARRNSIGVVKEGDIIDNEYCVKVEWDWAPNAGSWVRCGLLETIPVEKK